MDDGADGMQDMAAGEVVGLCDFGPPGGFFLLLLCHDPGALQPQLYSGKGMDGIVNTPVTGDETARASGCWPHLRWRHAAGW